jgi:hypothetical protein
MARRVTPPLKGVKARDKIIKVDITMTDMFDMLLEETGGY